MAPSHTIGSRRRRRVLIGDHKRLTEVKTDFFTRLKPVREQKDDRRIPIPPSRDAVINPSKVYGDPISEFVLKVSEKI